MKNAASCAQPILKIPDSYEYISKSNYCNCQVGRVVAIWAAKNLLVRKWIFITTLPFMILRTQTEAEAHSVGGLLV